MRAKRKPWPYWAKALRNFLLTLLAACCLWCYFGSPLPRLWEFRLAEKGALIPPTDIVLELTEAEFQQHTYVGLGEGVAVVYDYGLDIYPLEGGPILIPLGDNTTILHDEAGQPFTAVGYVALCPPEGTDYAVLDIKNDDGWFGTRGDARGDVFLFKLWPPPNGSGPGSSWFNEEKFTYSLRFYDEEQELLQKVTDSREDWPSNE